MFPRSVFFVNDCFISVPSSGACVRENACPACASPVRGFSFFKRLRFARFQLSPPVETAVIFPR